MAVAQRYNWRKDPDYWHRTQKGPHQKGSYDPKCRVCGAYYEPGAYSDHARSPKHRAALK